MFYKSYLNNTTFPEIKHNKSKHKLSKINNNNMDKKYNNIQPTINMISNNNKETMTQVVQQELTMQMYVKQQKQHPLRLSNSK